MSLLLLDQLLVVSGANSTWETLNSEIISLHKKKHTKWIYDFGEQGMTGCINSKGKIILIGGETYDIHFEVTKSKNCWIYDDIISVYPKLIKMLEKRPWSSSTLIHNELIWIVGGEGNHSDLSSTELLDIHSGESEHGINLPFTIRSHCAVEYKEQAIYIMGGIQNGEASSKTWIVNPDKDFEIVKGPRLKFARYSHSCGKMEWDGEVVLIVAGGYDGKKALKFEFC